MLTIVDMPHIRLYGLALGRKMRHGRREVNEVKRVDHTPEKYCSDKLPCQNVL